MSNNKYLTYEEFIDMGGSETLKQASFNLLEAKAENIINYYTFDRLKTLDTQVKEVKYCVYNLINIEQSMNKLKGKKSESIDGYSVAYEETENYKQQEHNEVYTWLANCKLENGIPYLYVGVENDNKYDYIHLP